MFSYGQFHDGAFDGLLIHDKTVYVFVSTDQKEHFVLIATGVVAMIANGMQAGNIILDVERWTAEELTLRDIRDVYGYQPSPMTMGRESCTGESPENGAINPHYQSFVWR